MTDLPVEPRSDSHQEDIPDGWMDDGWIRDWILVAAELDHWQTSPCCAINVISDSFNFNMQKKIVVGSTDRVKGVYLAFWDYLLCVIHIPPSQPLKYFCISVFLTIVFVPLVLDPVWPFWICLASGWTDYLD